MMDIELVAQAGALLSGSAEVGVPEGIRGTIACGWLSETEGATLSAAYARYWSVRAGASLLSSEPLDVDAVGEGGAAFLCRSAGYNSLDALQTALEAHYDKVDRLISAALQRDCVS